MKNLSRLQPVFILILFFALLIWVSCSKEDGAKPAAGTTATVAGRVTTPSGKNVPAATVKSGTFITKTNAEGVFTLTVPAGLNHLVIQTGNGRIFKTELALNLAGGQNMILPETQTVLKQILDLAYIPGDYDQIQTLITDSLGYIATAINVSNLSALPSFSQYGGLFLNCGLLTSENMDFNKYQNLMDYALNYGSIYASDYAVECFTGDGNLRLAGGQSSSSHDHATALNSFTTCINPILGGFIPDSALCTQKAGSDGFYSGATILDANMILAVGSNSLDVIYDLTAWEIVHSYDAPFTPFITHPSLGVLALQADLNPEGPTGGLYFTSFHTHPQGVSNEVEAILNYIILNL